MTNKEGRCKKKGNKIDLVKNCDVSGDFLKYFTVTTLQKQPL